MLTKKILIGKKCKNYKNILCQNAARGSKKIGVINSNYIEFLRAIATQSNLIIPI